MGTGYDCFDGAAHTRAAAISVEQRKWRQTLIAAMATLQGNGDPHKKDVTLTADFEVSPVLPGGSRLF